MSDQIGAEAMRQLGRKIKDMIPGLGFALIVFEFHKPGLSNYLSNARREDMIKALEETLARWKSNEEYKTPEEN
jgi:hypothetical protein